MKKYLLFTLCISGFAIAQSKTDSTKIKKSDSLTQKNKDLKSHYKNRSEADMAKFKILNAKPKNPEKYSILTKNNEEKPLQEVKKIMPTKRIKIDSLEKK